MITKDDPCETYQVRNNGEWAHHLPATVDS